MADNSARLVSQSAIFVEENANLQLPSLHRELQKAVLDEITALREPLFKLADKSLAAFQDALPSSLLIEDTSARFVGLFLWRAVFADKGVPIYFIKSVAERDEQLLRDVQKLSPKLGGAPLIVTEIIDSGSHVATLSRALAERGHRPSLSGLMSIAASEDKSVWTLAPILLAAGAIRKVIEKVKGSTLEGFEEPMNFKEMVKEMARVATQDFTPASLYLRVAGAKLSKTVVGIDAERGNDIVPIVHSNPTLNGVVSSENWRDGSRVVRAWHGGDQEKIQTTKLIRAEIKNLARQYQIERGLSTAGLSPTE